MTGVSKWVRDMAEEVIGGPPLQIGHRYQHPEDGLIEVTSGQYWGTHGLSNFWYWNVLDPETGKAIRSNHGYGSDWPEVKTWACSGSPCACTRCSRCGTNRTLVRVETD